MKVLYTPIRSKHKIKIDNEVVYIHFMNTVRQIDFTNLPDGKMVSPIDFVLYAERVEGELEITLQQPVTVEGLPIESDDFSVDDYKEIQVNWKTRQEIENEKNTPKPPTDKERLE